MPRRSMIGPKKVNEQEEMAHLFAQNYVKSMPLDRLQTQIDLAATEKELLQKTEAALSRSAFHEAILHLSRLVDCNLGIPAYLCQLPGQDIQVYLRDARNVPELKQKKYWGTHNWTILGVNSLIGIQQVLQAAGVETSQLHETAQHFLTGMCEVIGSQTEDKDKYAAAEDYYKRMLEEWTGQLQTILFQVPGHSFLSQDKSTVQGYIFEARDNASFAIPTPITVTLAQVEESVFVLGEYPMVGLTEEQQELYNDIESQPWFQALSPERKALLRPSIAARLQGGSLAKTQERNRVPAGKRNMYRSSMGILSDNGEKVVQKAEPIFIRSGTPAHVVYPESEEVRNTAFTKTFFSQLTRDVEASEGEGGTLFNCLNLISPLPDQALVKKVEKAADYLETRAARQVDTAVKSINDPESALHNPKVSIVVSTTPLNGMGAWQVLNTKLAQRNVEGIEALLALVTEKVASDSSCSALVDHFKEHDDSSEARVRMSITHALSETTTELSQLKVQIASYAILIKKLLQSNKKIWGQEKKEDDASSNGAAASVEPPEDDILEGGLDQQEMGAMGASAAGARADLFDEVRPRVEHVSQADLAQQRKVVSLIVYTVVLGILLNRFLTLMEPDRSLRRGEEEVDATIHHILSHIFCMSGKDRTAAAAWYIKSELAALFLHPKALFSEDYFVTRGQAREVFLRSWHEQFLAGRWGTTLGTCSLVDSVGDAIQYQNEDWARALCQTTANAHKKPNPIMTFKRAVRDLPQTVLGLFSINGSGRREVKREIDIDALVSRAAGIEWRMRTAGADANARFSVSGAAA